jgi:glycine cleavage system aminomethyltransferase T
VTSACRSPVAAVIALAPVHRSVWAEGTSLTVHHGFDNLPATIAELPLVRR